MGDSHVMIVDDVGQVVRGEAVGLQDDRVALSMILESKLVTRSSGPNCHGKPNLDCVHVVGGGAEDEVLEGLGARAQLQPHCEGGPRTKLPQIKHWTPFKMKIIKDAPCRLSPLR